MVYFFPLILLALCTSVCSAWSDNVETMQFWGPGQWTLSSSLGTPIFWF